MRAFLIHLACLILSTAPASETPTKQAFAASFAATAKAIAPCVVTVFSTKTFKPDNAFDDPILRHFFGRGSPGSSDRPFTQRGLGSGVVVSADGYILTNNHVIAGADEIRIGLNGKSGEYKATVVGSDEKSDLAVLKIEPRDKLTPIVFADIAQVEVGDVVLAVGNPFGVGQTVTMGIISAVGRGFGIVDYEDFLQTDASINPGNSGGALVDASGRLVGINTAILSRSGGNLGIGFAVPADFAHRIMDNIITNGRVTRGFLGVIVQPVTEDIAKALGAATQEGALVSDVAEKSPAEKAGLQSGDIITKIGDEPIADPRHLRLHVSQLKPGTKTNVTVLRGEQQKVFEVAIADLPEKEAAERRDRKEHGDSEGQLGVALRDLDDDLRKRFDVPKRVQGALVAEVAPLSPAQEAGLAPGSVIMEIDRKPVKSAAEAAKTLRGKDGSALLHVWTQDGGRFTVLRPRIE